MVLENKLHIAHQVELSRAEEKISKQKAKQLFDTGDIRKVEAGTFAGLCFIHRYLFEDIYAFAGHLQADRLRAAKSKLASAGSQHEVHSRGSLHSRLAEILPPVATHPAPSSHPTTETGSETGSGPQEAL